MTNANPAIWEIGNWDITLRILLALIIGGLIGFEREWNNHPAGFRTHILVCIGSALIMLLSIYGFSAFAEETNVRLDPARLAAQVISGIGFLGAGTILRTGLTISGLTTAASLWVVAAIGLAVGAGFYYGAVLASFLVIISLFLLNKWEKHFINSKKNRELRVHAVDRPGILGDISAQLRGLGLQIARITVQPVEDQWIGEQKNGTTDIRFLIKVPGMEKWNASLQAISGMEDVLEVKSGTVKRQGISCDA